MRTHTPFNPKDHPEEHDNEHKVWSRRSFLQALGIAGSGSMMLGSQMLTASAPSPFTAALSSGETDNILILIRLNGGNDGLSTVIPLQQFDTYANVRPNIFIPESKIIKLTDNFGVPSYMEPAERLWGEGQFRAVHGVGYDNQSLSHFTGSDIFANTDLNTTGFDGLNTGWMGRHFEQCFPNYLLDPPPSPAALQIGDISNLVFQGEETNYAFVTNNINQLEEIAESGLFYDLDNALFDGCMYGDQLRFLRGVANTTYEYSGTIHDAYLRGQNQVEYQDNDFARQLALLARLIKGNLGTRVYMISMGGFDTHGNQTLRHENLMSTLTNAIENFYQDLAFTEQDRNVLSMTFSEFGRRIFENGSFGTDHGKAAPTLFFGAGLNGSSFVGDHPDLEAPNSRGNLEFTMDFRDLYATVLAEWLCVPIPLVEQHLLGHSYQPVNLGFNCSGTEFPDIAMDDNPPDLPDTPVRDEDEQGDGAIVTPIDAMGIVHNPFYPAERNPHIFLQLPFTAHVDIQLYNILGQRMGTLYNEMVLEGAIEINVQERMQSSLAPGRYIYQISVRDERFSKTIIV